MSAVATVSSVDQCAVLIPAYDPDDTLPALVAELRDWGFSRILVIDDGSRGDKQPVFAHCAEAGAKVLAHDRNRGKGAALKTGLAHIAEMQKAAVEKVVGEKVVESTGEGGSNASLLPVRFVVTVDADGQHLPRDVAAVCTRALALRRPAVVLGVRHFDDDTPLRSRFGNVTTRLVFRSLTGQAISDTQTGLRALPVSLIPRSLEISGDRYEYEMRMLALLVREHVPIVEVTISTVYLDGNASSHFRPLVDSVRIYSALLKDLLLALASFGLDVALFSLALHLTHGVVLSTYLARSVSVVFNFLGNKYYVFRGNQTHSMPRQIALYGCAALLLATASGLLVGLFADATAAPPTPVKVFVDLGLYLVSYAIRRYLIFRLE